MTINEAVQNAKIKVSAYKAAQTTLQRRLNDRDHFAKLFDKAKEDFDQAYKDVEAAREFASNAKHELFEAIERETY